MTRGDEVVKLTPQKQLPGKTSVLLGLTLMTNSSHLLSLTRSLFTAVLSLLNSAGKV